MNARTIAAIILVKVIFGEHHLGDALQKIPASKMDPRDFSLITELCYGVCRWYFRLAFYVKRLMPKPLKNKDSDLYCLLLIGIYQLVFLRVSDHAAVNETVNSAQELKKPWAKNLLNAVLRNFQRQQLELDQKAAENDEFTTSHPTWLIDMVKHDWPNDWQTILEANNRKAPLNLRVNLQKISRQDYLQQLSDRDIQARISPFVNCGIELIEAVNVEKLPGFSEGLVTVQDTSAQLAAILLDPNEGDRILDACAAPGGKTTHIAEVQPNLAKLVAIDRFDDRIDKLKTSCARLRVCPEIINCDANEIATWWDGELFDRILLDAPCSATGVIRRHPDIKIHRTQQDIEKLSEQQIQLLNSLWQVLKPGGILLYVTCSLLANENETVIEKFLKTHEDAREEIITAEWGVKKSIGRQIIPSQNGDGFYFAKLVKGDG